MYVVCISVYLCIFLYNVVFHICLCEETSESICSC